MTTQVLRVGARASTLSRRQTHLAIDLITSIYPEISVTMEVISTIGDRDLDTPLPLMGAKGVFTEEIESALLLGRIDFAVHSLKDLPVESRQGIAIGAIPERASVEDMLISRQGLSLQCLPSGSRIGTSSFRRSAQILAVRPDLLPVSIRGNVETRLRKVLDAGGDFDAIVLARAGLDRLDLTSAATEQLSLELMLPAPGQGALAIQCRDDQESRTLFEPLNHQPTLYATIAERSFLAGLGGGCSMPVAAFGEVVEDELTLIGRVIAIDGGRQIDVRLRSAVSSRETAVAAGLELAEDAISNNAMELLGTHA